MQATASSTFSCAVPPHLYEADSDAADQQDAQEQGSPAGDLNIDASGTFSSSLRDLLPDSALHPSIAIQLQAKPQAQAAEQSVPALGFRERGQVLITHFLDAAASLEGQERQQALDETLLGIRKLLADEVEHPSAIADERANLIRMAEGNKGLVGLRFGAPASNEAPYSMVEVAAGSVLNADALTFGSIMYPAGSYEFAFRYNKDAMGGLMAMLATSDHDRVIKALNDMANQQVATPGGQEMSALQFASRRDTAGSALMLVGSGPALAAGRVASAAVGTGLTLMRSEIIAMRRASQAAQQMRADINAARINNNFYSEGAIADPGKPMSPTGPWKSAAEPNPERANALVKSSLPPDADIINTTSVNGKNAAAKKDQLQPPYLPDSDIVLFSSSRSGQYVRLYGNGSKQTGTWIVRAEDIAGLTKEQVASKFSLPQPPTMITDVTLPPRTWLNASVANGVSPRAAEGIFTGDNVGGGGVQFQIDQQSMSRLRPGEFESWFSNERPIK